MHPLFHSWQTLSRLFIFINTNIGNTSGIISSTIIAHSLFIAITFNSLYIDKAKREAAQTPIQGPGVHTQKGHGKSSAQRTDKMARLCCGDHSTSPGSFRKSLKPIRLSRTLFKSPPETSCCFHEEKMCFPFLFPVRRG